MLYQVDCTFDHAQPSDDPTKVEFALIERVEDFEALAGQWRALAARAARPHQIFQCHSWLAAWCAHYHDPGNLATDQPANVVAYRDGGLILALPLIVRRRFGVRMLKWMGMPVSQYGDVLVDEHPAARHLIEAALQFAVTRTRPDLVLLRKVRDDARIAPVIEGLGGRVLLQAEAPYIDLAAWSDGEGHLRSLSAKASKQRRRRRRLEDLGAVSFSFLPRSKAAGEQARIAVREKRATQAGVWNALDDRFEAFFADYCGRQAGDMRAVVATLFTGVPPVAREIGFIHKGHYIAHVGSFDPAYASCAPGTLQIDDTIKACFEAGIHTYDLLAPADDYKRALATASIPVRDWVLPRTARGALYCRVAEGLVPRLKRLRDRVDGVAKRWQRRRAAAR